MKQHAEAMAEKKYKIFRCADASELARDAGGKRHAGAERLRAAEAACGEVVAAVLAGRRRVQRRVYP